MIEVSFFSILLPDSNLWIASIFRKPLVLIVHHASLISPTTRKQAALNDPNQWRKFCKIFPGEIFLRYFCKVFDGEIFVRYFSKICGGEIFDAGKMTWTMVLPF